MIYINEYDVINKYYEKFHDIHRVVSILLRGYSQTTWTAIVGGWVRKGEHSVHLY